MAFSVLQWQHGAMGVIRWLAASFMTVVGACLTVLAFPQPLFAHHLTYGNYEVWSDRPISPAIRQVLDDVTRRLGSSELYDPSQPLRIFFCHESWRLSLYSQRFSSGMGGVADDWLTRNIYIRAADIDHNRIIPPGPELLDADVRPLSYFIAHEATHILESREFGRLASLRYPAWLREGYADYIGKGGEFGLAENLVRLRNGDPLMDPVKSGLYRRHHLLVAYLLDHRRVSLRALYADPPHEKQLLQKLLRSKPQ